MINNIKERLKYSTDKEKEQLFFTACAQNRIEDVIYMINNEKMSILLNDGMAIRTACMYGSLTVLKYFYENPQLSKDINIHIKHDAPFKMASRLGRIDILEYLVFEKNIDKTEEIVKYFEKNPNKIVEAMFKARDLNNNLIYNQKNETIQKQKI